MNSVKKRKECATVDEYLMQFDFHTHVFSHCVFTHKEISDSKMNEKSEKEKLKLFSSNLEDLFTSAAAKGVKIVGVSDHPQFLRYDIRYSKCAEIFERKRKRFRKIKILQGLEADINVSEEGKIFFDYENIADRELDFDMMINQVHYIIGSLHHKNFKKHTLPVDRKTYHKFILSSVDELAKLKARIKEQTGEDKPVILGHPYCIIGETNYKHHDNSPHLKDTYPTKSDYLASNDCIIKPFDAAEVNAIVKKLADNGIMTEINGLTIRKGHSDIRKSDPFYTTIAAQYLEYCRKNSVAPQMLVNSDAHKADDLVSFELETVRKNIGEENLESITVPYQQFLG